MADTEKDLEQKREKRRKELMEKIALDKQTKDALLKSCYLTVIPEAHSLGIVSQSVIPLLQGVLRKEPTDQILNVSEGNNEDVFFKRLHDNNPRRTILTEEECIRVQTSPEFANCLRYYSALIVELHYLDSLFEVPVKNISQITGLGGRSLDQDYASDILTSMYMFQTFIPYDIDAEKGENSFFMAFNTSYLDVIDQTRRPYYERHIGMMLRNAKTYFVEKCSETIREINISIFIDQLIALGTNRQERMKAILRQKKIIRELRDFYLVEYIKRYVTDERINKGKSIRYVIIYVGAAHYTNLLQITQGVFSDNDAIIRMQHVIGTMFASLIDKGASIDQGEPMFQEFLGGRRIQKRYKKSKSKSKQADRRQSKRRQSKRRQSNRNNKPKIIIS
jgi:hypothetical protein